MSHRKNMQQGLNHPETFVEILRRTLESILSDARKAKLTDLDENNDPDNPIQIERVLMALHLVTFGNDEEYGESPAVVLRIFDQVTRRLENYKNESIPRSSFEEIVLASAVVASKLTSDMAIRNRDFQRYFPLLTINDMLEIERKHLKQLGISSSIEPINFPGDKDKLHVRLTHAMKSMSNEDLIWLQNAFTGMQSTSSINKAAFKVTSDLIATRMKELPLAASAEKPKDAKRQRSSSVATGSTSGLFSQKAAGMNKKKDNKPKQKEKSVDDFDIKPPRKK